jgi:hypothetical protein
MEHMGEKSIVPLTLFSKVLYAPTFTPQAGVNEDPCRYGGFSRMFAVNYNNGNSAYNNWLANDDPDDEIFVRRDRYLSTGSMMQSAVTIIIKGRDAVFISSGTGDIDRGGSDDGGGDTGDGGSDGSGGPTDGDDGGGSFTGDAESAGTLVPLYWQEILDDDM